MAYERVVEGLASRRYLGRSLMRFREIWSRPLCLMTASAVWFLPRASRAQLHPSICSDHARSGISFRTFQIACATTPPWTWGSSVVDMTTALLWRPWRGSPLALSTSSHRVDGLTPCSIHGASPIIGHDPATPRRVMPPFLSLHVPRYSEKIHPSNRYLK